jgi:hypothetical protein
MRTRPWVVACLLLTASFGVHAETRVALVIGNAAYTQVGQLTNPVNDAHLITARLRQDGFEVTEYANLDLDRMSKAIQAFGKQLTAGGQKRVGFIYYSGHGVQANGHNYLIPVDASPHREADLAFQAVDASAVMNLMNGAGVGVNIVVLDACRDNPFPLSTKTLHKGLARIETGAGEFYLAYATAPDTVAQDGSGADSPYATALAAAMVLPGLTIEEAFKRVRAQVLHDTKGEQQPWESSSLVTDFYFWPGSPAQRPSASTGSASTPQHAENTGRIYIYRLWAMSASMSSPTIALNGETLGPLTWGQLFYVDRAPGNYELISVTAEIPLLKLPRTERKVSFVLEPGQKRYIRIYPPLSEIGFTPELIDSGRGVQEIAGLQNTQRTTPK